MYAGSLLKANKSDVGIPIEFQLELTNNSGQLIISHLHKNNIVMACMYAYEVTMFHELQCTILLHHTIYTASTIACTMHVGMQVSLFVFAIKHNFIELFRLMRHLCTHNQVLCIPTANCVNMRLSSFSLVIMYYHHHWSRYIPTSMFHSLRVTCSKGDQIIFSHLLDHSIPQLLPNQTHQLSLALVFLYKRNYSIEITHHLPQHLHSSWR